MDCDSCEQSRSIDIEHDRGDRLSVTLIVDPADHDGNEALIDLLPHTPDGWAGQVRATADSDAVLGEFEFSVEIEGDVLTVVGVIIDTDDFTTSAVFDFQATLDDGGTLTFLGGSTITTVGDVTRVTGS